MRKLLFLLMLIPIFTGITTANAQVICQASFSASVGTNPYVINFQNTSGVGGAYYWSFGDGATSNATNPTHSYNGAGWYAVCLTVSDTMIGCTSSFCDTIWAGQTACSAVFTYSISGTNQIQFTSNNASATTSWSWSFGDGTSSNLASPIHIYPNNGTYQVCLTITDATGCVNTSCQPITISNPNPGCSVSYTHIQNSPNVVSFTATSSPAITNGIYTWSFGDGTQGSGHQITHTYTQLGYYNVCVTTSNPATGCSATYCDSIFVNGTTGACQAAFTYNVTASGIALYDSSFGGAISWAWTLPNGNISTQQHPVVQLNPGTYTICLTITTANGCTSNVCQSVVVPNTTACHAGFNYSASPANPFAFSFNNTSVGGTQYLWNFGDGSTSTSSNPNHTYTLPGTYTVCLLISNPNTLCQASYCDTLVVGSSVNCTAYFTYQQASASGAVYFAGSSNQNSVSYTWSFGDSTNGTGQNPIHTYASAGTYHVCVTATSLLTGCSNTYCSTINVLGPNTACQANFYFQSTNSGLVYFSNASIGGGATYQWSFGDGTGSSAVNPTHQFTNGVWTVCLTMTTANGCSSLICKIVTVPGNTNCMASFIAIPDSNGTGYSFSNTSIGTNGPYHWDFGDGTTSTQQNPYHIFTAAGTFTVCLTTGSPSLTCIDTYCMTVTVNAPTTCVPTFYTSPDTSAFGNGVINFIVHSTCGGSITWSWNFGDGSTSTTQNPSHQFNGTGWYNVCVTATLSNGSIYTHCDSVYVFRLASGINELETIGVSVYPNPSNDGSWISFDLTSNEYIKLQVFDLSGRMIATIADGFSGPGNHKYRWNAEDVTAGMFLVRLQAGDRIGMTRIAIIR